MDPPDAVKSVGGILVLKDGIAPARSKFAVRSNTAELLKVAVEIIDFYSVHLFSKHKNTADLKQPAVKNIIFFHRNSISSQ